MAKISELSIEEGAGVEVGVADEKNWSFWTRVVDRFRISIVWALMIKKKEQV